MDLQELVDSFSSSACVLSVERTADGGYGEICIEAGNKYFLAHIEQTKLGDSLSVPENSLDAVVPGSPYEKYIPKDIGFEDICFRAAVTKTPVHTYFHRIKPDIWLGFYALPLEYEDGAKSFCLFIAVPGSLEDVGLSGSHSASTYEDILRTCIKLHATDDFKKTMSEVIGDIRVICGAEVCTLMLVDTSAETCSVLATNIAENSTIKRVTQFVNFYEIAMSWVRMLDESDCLIIKSEKDMKYVSEVNNPWYLTLAEAGVDSVVMFPLRYNNELLGFIWATNFDTKNTLRIKDTLELTTFFISSEVSSYKVMQRLEYISFTDLLTGVRNRNAMNNRVSEILSQPEYSDVPFGVIFADLNGLKQVNDAEGHNAGDIILRKAAIHLEEHFGDCEIYRAGGDEFVVFFPGCTEQELDGKVELLRKNPDVADGVCFSGGAAISPSGSQIREAMHAADEAMYRNKEKYYSEHPERKIR